MFTTILREIIMFVGVVTNPDHDFIKQIQTAVDDAFMTFGDWIKRTREDSYFLSGM